MPRPSRGAWALNSPHSKAHTQMQHQHLARRGFLRGLASLPLIGGGVTLIGNPTAAAEPPTKRVLDSYDAWLEIERNFLLREVYGDDWRSHLGAPAWRNPGERFFLREYGTTLPAASTRAAVVLSAVGVAL
jgi:hypothetical protein